VPGRTWEYVDDESVVVLAAVYTAIGFMVGLIQWFLLRRQFPNSLVWLLGSSLGPGLGFGLVLASGLISQSGIISSIIVVLVYASATGLALEWLHGHDAKTHSHLPNAT
jgi:predicted Abi (CAAX) family protease